MARPTRKQLFSPTGTPRIAVVGAGFGGIGLGVKLKKAGIESFTIFDAAEEPGGTWWHNHYPGAEVDTVSLAYSYGFRPNGWTRTHAKQPELLAYLNETIDEYGVREHLCLGTEVKSAVWDEHDHVYHLTLGSGAVESFHVVVGATGFLNIPKYPTWPGLEDFRGPMFHTSRWEHQHDLTGKTVAVVGVGSTSTQVIPEIAPLAKKLYVFQREPGWIVPKGDRDYTDEERARLAKPWYYRWKRIRWFLTAEKLQWRAAVHRPGTPENMSQQQAALDFINKEFGDRPDLRKVLTPDYPVGGKRLIQNSTFYSTLKRDNVELVSRGVASVTEDAVVDGDGIEHKVDVLILGTGFQPTDYLGTMEVRGRNGNTLQEYWAGEARAFLGITVPTFPNFFIMYGPGTNGGEIVSMLMHQADYIVGAVKRMMRQRVTAIEVKDTWADMWHAWLQSKVNTTVFALGNNYYRGPTGKIVTQWPFGAGVYGVLNRVLGSPSESARRKRTDESARRRGDAQ